MKKKMLYLMRIDWYWIFQRPQILALELEKYFDVTVVFPKERKERNSTFLTHPLPQHYIETIFLPFRDKIRLCRWLHNLNLKRKIGNIEQFDVIWVGYPTFTALIPNSYKGIVIYDYMDDYEALYPDGIGRQFLKEDEKELLKRTDIVFASSKKLQEILVGKEYKNSILLRNGFRQDMVLAKPKRGECKKQYHLGYFGTISDWMDFGTLIESLHNRNDITYHIIGPVDSQLRREIKGLVWEGTCNHKNLPQKVKDYDCLVMPFILNDIVLAVDPVKLYEYICLGKCIVSVYYPEIERFRDFVYFYKTTDEYIVLMDELIQKGFPAKYNQDQQRNFLADNTWQKRLKIVNQTIQNTYTR